MGSSSSNLSKTSLKVLWGNSRWALALAWATHRRLMLSLITVMLLLSLVPAGLAITIRGLINAITEAIQGDGSANEIILWLGAGLGVTLLEVVGGFAIRFFDQRLNDELNLRITADILEHAARLDVTYFEDPRFQDMMDRVQQNVARRFSQFVTRMIKFVTSVIQMVSLTSILMVIEPLVLVVLLVVAFPYLFVQWRLAKSRYKDEFHRVTKVRWTHYFVSRLTTQDWVPESKILNLAPLFVAKFRALMSEFRDQNRKIHSRIFMGSSLFAGLSSIAFFFTFGRVALRVLDGSLTLGDVAIYGGATSRLRSSLEDAILSITEALEQTLHIANLRAFLEIQPQIRDTKGLVPVASEGRIDFRDVTFTYAGTQKPVLKNVSLVIQPGEAVAIVGKNGAGKTTLVKLLARLYEPDSGRILFDNTDIREISLDYLYQQVAFVFQRYGRYEATVADNIAYGDWERLQDSPEEIEKIAKLAGVDKMIADMPDGYDTLLGRMFGEYTLSGGQWQKIAIARAFARDASLLILDEPTSNLDAISEYRIFSNFRQLAKGRTTILVSHRFSTVSMADRILVLDNGRIVESGDHDQLMELNGHYASLYQHHARKMGLQKQSLS